jgi:diadenosine tetraphosphatase ApaH/serine/threonine PP2A family protein phosphatase
MSDGCPALSLECPQEILDFLRANPNFFLPEALVVDIATRLMEHLLTENNVLLLSSPVVVCGDIHGQFADLLGLLDQASAGIRRYLFLGDYVDRGPYSLNAFLYLACMKLRDPDLVFLLRGNHEARGTNYRYGFFAVLHAGYGSASLWRYLQAAFDLLPLAALIDRDVFCVHGGISPSIALVERIALLDRRKEVPNKGPISDLLWSDPGDADGWVKNARGAGFIFGPAQSRIFCHLNRVYFVARAHQCMPMGWKAHHLGADGKPHSYAVLTLFSAPNYQAGQKNLGAYMEFPNLNHRQIKTFTSAQDAAGRFKRPDEQTKLSALPKFMSHS